MEVSREEFDNAVEVVWAEIEYQNNLARRTSSSEAKDVPGFLTLGRRYLRQTEDNWTDHAGDELGLHGLRKLGAIFIRGMIYCGIRNRS